jgi:predicted GNAT family N-acyltransferase
MVAPLQDDGTLSADDQGRGDEIVVVLADAAALAICLSIRHAVFVVEQGVAPTLEQDGRDPQAWHFLAHRADEAVGTARVLLRDRHVARIGRVAVLAHARRCGVGEALLRAVLDEPALRAVTRFELHAQVRATAFYQRLGYRVHGTPFLEAGMPHVEMMLERGAH